MVLGDNVVQAGINFVADTKALDAAKRAVSSLNTEMAETVAAATAMGEGVDKANRSLGKQAGAASAASTSLAGLEAQLFAARAAEESFAENTGDLRGALNSLKGDAGGTQEAIRQMAEEITGAHDSIEDIDSFDLDAPESFIETFDSADADEMEEFLNAATGLETNFDDLASDMDPTLDQVRDIDEAISDISQYDDDAISRVLQAPDMDEMSPRLREFLKTTKLGDTALTDVMEGQAHLFHDFDDDTRLIKFFERSLTDLTDQMGEALYPPRDASHGKRGSGGGSAGGSLRHAIYQAVMGGGLTEEGLPGPDPDNVPDAVEPPDTSDLATLPDDVDLEGIEDISDFEDSLGIATFDKILPPTIAEGMGDDISKTEFLPKDLDHLSDVLTTTDIPLNEDKFEQLITDFTELSEIPEAWDSVNLPPNLDELEDVSRVSDLFDPDIIESDETLQRLADEGFHEDLSEMLKAFRRSRIDEQLQKARRNFKKISDATESVAFADAFGDVETFDDLEEAITEFDEQLELVETENFLDKKGDEFIEQFDSLVKEDTIDEGHTRRVMEDKIGDITDDAISHLRDDQHPAARLSDTHNELLADIMGDLQPGLIRDADGVDEVPIARENIRMALLQEMLDADTSDARFRVSEDILKRLEAGQLGVGASLFDAESDMLRRDLAAKLPDEMVEADIPTEILRRFRDRPYGISQYLGDDPRVRIEDPISEALQNTDFDEARQRLRVAEAVEDILPAARERSGNRTGPGVIQATRGAEDIGVGDLSRERTEDIEEYRERLRDTLETLKDVQHQSSILRGASTHKLPGGDDRQRSGGVFGMLMGGVTRAISGTGFDRPSRIRAIQDRLESLNRVYKEMLPLLDTGTLHLGMLNVRFESMAKMLFKLTAMIGPFVAGLAAIATGAATAAAGLASFVGVGAVQYLDEMEDSMAGVSDKQDAISELSSTLRQMGWEALAPLRGARIGGDGATPMQLFVDMIRGALVLLNRFAGAMAYIAEMDVVAEQTARLSEIIMGGTDDDTFMHQMATVVENTLPLIVSFIDALTSWFGPAMVEASRIAKVLAETFAMVGDETSGAFRLMIWYGAGFINAMLQVARVVGEVVMFIEGLLNTIGVLTGALPILSGSAEGLVFQFGMLVGVLNIISRVGTSLIMTWSAMTSAVMKLAKALTYLNLAAIRTKNYLIALRGTNLALSASFYSAATAAGALAAAMLGVTAVLVVLHDLWAWLTGGDELLFDLSKGWHAVAAAITAATGALMAFKGAMAFSSLVGLGAAGGGAAGAGIAGGGLISILKGGAMSVLGGIATAIGGISATTAGLVALVGSLVVLGADFLHWIITGESKLASWFGWLKPIESLYAKIAKWAQKIAGAIPGWGDLKGWAGGAMDFIGNIGGGRGPSGPNNRMVRRSKYVTNQSQSHQNESSGSGRVRGRKVDVRIQNNGVIGDKDLSRTVRKEVERKVDDEVKRGG